MKVLSIEQMTRLKQLGVDTDKASIRVGQMIFTQSDPWYGTEKYYIYLLDHEDNDTNCFFEEYRTFTLQDFIELLPKSILINSVKHWIKISPNCLLTEFQIMYVDGDDSYAVMKQDKSLLQAAYNMLIWVIENNYLKTK